jgi:hypothetical protein
MRLTKLPLWLSVRSSVCVFPLITFEPINRFLLNSVELWRWPRCHSLLLNTRLQPFQNGGCSAFRGGCINCISQRGTNILTHISSKGEPGSSVRIMSGYRLENRAIEVRSLAEAKGFFLLPLCPDRLWGLPSLLHNGYWGFFPEAKAWPGRDADHSPTPSADVENE